MKSILIYAVMMGGAALVGCLIPVPRIQSARVNSMEDVVLPTHKVQSSPSNGEVVDLLRELIIAEDAMDYGAMRPLQLRAAHSSQGFRITAQQLHLRNAILDLTVAARPSSAGALARRIVRASEGFEDAVMSALVRCRSLGASDGDIGVAAARRYSAIVRSVPLNPPRRLEGDDEVETCRLGKVVGPEFDPQLIGSEKSAWLTYARGAGIWAELDGLDGRPGVRAAEYLADGTKDFAAVLPLPASVPLDVWRVPVVRWVYRDPLGALSWVRSLQDAQTRDVLLEAVGFQVGSCRQEVVEQALNQCRETEFLKGMIRGMCLRNPEEALPVYRQLEEEDRDILAFILKQSAYVDPVKAAMLQMELMPESPERPVGVTPASSRLPERELPEFLIARSAPDEVIVKWLKGLSGETAEQGADKVARCAAVAGRRDLAVASMELLRSISLEGFASTLEIILGSDPDLVQPLAAAGLGMEDELRLVAEKTMYKGTE